MRWRVANEVAVGSCNPGESPVLMWLAQIDLGGVATDLLQAHVSSMTYTVKRGSQQVGDPGTLAVSSTVYDTPQTGSAWTEALGEGEHGNVAVRIPGSYLTAANRTYAVNVAVNLTGGTTFNLRGRVTTLD